MSNHSLSLRLKPDVRARLEAEADVSEQNVAEIALTAIENYLEGQAEKRIQLQQAIAEAEKGAFVSDEKIAEWIASWGDENELLPPEPDVFLKPPKAI